MSCPRSTSIDSLRTTGHSRSVSHDSYFDLLQSPLRGGMTTCPSRELSELGINFDREEPEMRIFSESESLVSSPKMAKETTRRVLRARPEEFSSTANSVNPSPKKQPRLNLQSPPEMKTWATIVNENNANSSDESSCKRYKLEDQLSDIQFIDCNTPEHIANANANTNTGYAIYTSIQIHDNKTIIDTENVQLRNENDRYSYPVSQYSYVKNSPVNSGNKEDRFSYPITISHREQSKENDKNNENIYQMKVGTSENSVTNKKANTIDIPGFSGNMGFYVEYEKNPVPRSSSACADVTKKQDVSKSKLSIVTPQSPVKSPCYSLLIGSTTSSNSNSSTNPTTPIFDMDVCNPGHFYEPINFQTKEESSMRSKKHDLCLELNNRNVINVQSSPTTSYHNTMSENTTNTSQSITPSEIGYQNLPETEEPVKPTIVSVSSPPTYVKPPSPTISKSPIKSTINITYNLKSPTKKCQEFFQELLHEPPKIPEEDYQESDEPTIDSQDEYYSGNFQNDTQKSQDHEEQEIMSEYFPDEYVKKEPQGLLETSFDETMVYEQVKYFKNNVSQVNNLLSEQEIQKLQIVPDIGGQELEKDAHYENVTNDDVNMMNIEDSEDQVDHEGDDGEQNQDSLEYDQNLSMYENVELRRPAKIYENIQMPSSLNCSPIRIPKARLSKYAIDDLEKDMDFKIDTFSGSSKPSNFIVKQLATKFETSPVDSGPHSQFEFSTSVKTRSSDGNGSKKDNYSITRSLDENAFIREFGSAKKFEEFQKNIKLVENSGRRKSVDCSPKQLSPVKKPSPNLERSKTLDKPGKLKLNFEGKPEDIRNYSVRITPTTENRISLIQHNFEAAKNSSDEEKEKSTSTTSLTSLKMLGSCKLDRERIEKIKEERRHQLSEKYRSESFRNLNNNKLSKPKNIDFEDTGSVRFKSKSRNELLSNIENEQPYSLITTSSTSTNSLTRTRRISDEKNQNDVIDDENVVLRSNRDGVSDSRDKENRQRPKFEKKSFEFSRERNGAGNNFRFSQGSSQ